MLNRFVKNNKYPRMRGPERNLMLWVCSNL